MTSLERLHHRLSNLPWFDHVYGDRLLHTSVIVWDDAERDALEPIRCNLTHGNGHHRYQYTCRGSYRILTLAELPGYQRDEDHAEYYCLWSDRVDTLLQGLAQAGAITVRGAESEAADV